MKSQLLAVRPAQGVKSQLLAVRPAQPEKSQLLAVRPAQRAQLQQSQPPVPRLRQQKNL